MRTKVFSLLAILALAASSAFGQARGDAADLFLNAYMAYQKAEKADGTGDTRTAIRSYNSTITLCDQISQRWPAWNPPIIKHRRARAAEALTRLQGGANRMPAVDDGADDPRNSVLGDPTPLPDNGPLPGDSIPLAPSELPRERTRTRSSEGPIQEIQDRMESLQTDLQTAKDKLSKAAEEKKKLAEELAEALKAAKESAVQQETLQKRADLAETELRKAAERGDANAAELASLKKDVAESQKKLRDLQYERDAEAELREQMTGRMTAAASRIEELGRERDAAKKDNADVPAKIAEMQKQIDSVMSEKGDLETKLAKVEQQLKQVSGERDEALEQLAKMKEASKNVDKLLAENTSLMAKLDTAQKEVATLKAGGVQKDAAIKRLTADVASVQKQLADAQEQSAQYQTQMTDLRKQLDTQSQELAQVKAGAVKSAEERKKLIAENELLRGIVLRAQKQQADKEQVKKLVLAELAKLEVNSKALATQIDLLGAPVVKLSEKEKKLFKQPVLSIGDEEIAFGSPTASAAPPPPADDPKEAPPKVAKADAKTDAPQPEVSPAVETTVDEPAPAGDSKLTLENTPLPDPMPELSLDEPVQELAKADAGKPGLTPPAPDKKEAAASSIEGDLPARETEETQALSEPDVNTSAEPAVPEEIVGLCRDAKDQFERGNYRDAEKIYLKALAMAPKNLHVLSNLGVVLFRASKFEKAEEMFKKAIAIAPEDDFSHCTLGIVKYSQGKYDEAIDELTRSLAINSKNATAHNYLGITASQMGWQEAAQKELETATALDPNYPDAHFNLAVVFATQTPPNKESARQHYKRAVELGAEPDAKLEELIK